LHSFIVLASCLILSAAGSSAQQVAFVVKPAGQPARVLENETRSRLRLTPCSTFKIPNTAIGLESGVIPGPEFLIHYNAEKHKRKSGFFPDAWAKDHDLRSAFRNSVVWYYQEIAERAGHGKMQQFVDRFAYGNRDAAGPETVFWLGSSLRISAVEQTEFLDSLFANRFQLQPRTLTLLTEFMLQEQRGPTKLYGKTGAGTDPAHGPVVWFVGFVETAGQRTFFAMNAGHSDMDAIFNRRIDLAKERLVQAGLYPPQ
jgi:beta-lactamase class D